MYFGHERGDKYSVLVFDNRGAGASDRPFMRYSTSEMAHDLLELLDHLNWVAKRELHISGGSSAFSNSESLVLILPPYLDNVC